MNTENNKNGPFIRLPENICPKCRRKDRLEVEYCSKCGTPLVEEGELEKYLKWKKIANVLRALIIAAIIAAIGIIYVNQKKGAAEKPYVPSINVADNHESDKNRIAHLEKEKAEAEQKAAVEAEKIKQEKDQIAQAKKAADEETAQSANNYNVGDIIEFGSYPYEADGTEKTIKGQILKKYNDGTALVISKYALDALRYNETSINITWEKSTIRKWLNNDFYNSHLILLSFL